MENKRSEESAEKSLPLTRHSDIRLVLDTPKGTWLIFFYTAFIRNENRNSIGFIPQQSTREKKRSNWASLIVIPIFRYICFPCHDFRVFLLSLSIVFYFFTFYTFSFFSLITRMWCWLFKSGRGVFAAARIPAHTIVETCPVLVLDPTENKNHVEKTELFHYT